VEQQVELAKTPGFRSERPQDLPHPWVLGTWVQHGEVPVIHFSARLPDSPRATPPAMYVVDLERSLWVYIW
jgi:hypothetical protein